MNNFQEKVFDSFESDVKLYYCGKRIHNLSHKHGPYLDDKYLIYYIKEGKAKLTHNGKSTLLCAPMFFVNFPNSNCVYQCLEGVPWSIKWIMTDGSTIEKYLALLNITPEIPFAPLSDGKNIESVFDEMYELFDKKTVSSKIYCVSLVHKLFALLSESIRPKTKENEYVHTALELIQNYYSDSTFNVSALAKKIGLNANYFSILFKDKTGKTPIKALSDYRLECACKTLKFTNKAIKEISLDCGFSDELYFSRAFKKSYGVSPTKFRESEQYLT